MTERRLRVLLLMRPARERGYSIEAVFNSVATHVSDDIDLQILRSVHVGRGVLPRLGALFEARRAARDADVVHQTGDTHFQVLLLAPQRTMLTVHDCEFLDRSRGLKRFLLWLFWLRLPAARVRLITTVSTECRRQLLRWLPGVADRAVVVENPLAKPLVFCPAPFCGDRPQLLMIGTAPHKNIERAVAALAGLPVLINVIGPLTPVRLAALRDHGVEVETRQGLSEADLAAAYAGADALLFPSLAEGFGLPILEAQAVGRPVITADRAPMSDVAGKGALLVDPEDPAAIRAAVERLRNDPGLCAELVAAGRENLQRFTPQAAAARYATLWRQMAAAG